MDIDTAIHRLGIAVSIVVLGGGAVLFFLPETALSLPVNLLFADIAALAAVVLAGIVVRDRRRARPALTFVPDVEFPLSTPSPGHDLDELIYRVTELGEGTIEYREQIRERFTETAIAIIRQRTNCSREEAIAQLQEGNWTENDAAAQFFRGASPSVSLFEQLRARLTEEESGYERQLRETIGAIEEQATFLTGEAADGQATGDGSEPDAGMAATDVIVDDEGEPVSEQVRYRSLLETYHWSGISAFALAAIAVGTISSQPAVLLAGAVGLAGAAYSRVWSPPDLAGLEATRSLSEDRPEPGTEVEVTVTVENTGGTLLPDLRLVDRVPPTLRVVDGSPRLGAALTPGDSVTFTYEIVAEQGNHSWPLQVIGRDPAGSREREALIDTDTTMFCAPQLTTVSEAHVRLQTSVYTGQVGTKTSGEGLEFFSVRDYLPGDPMRRINWMEYARTGEFATVNYRQEEAAKIVLLFDSRESSYVSGAPGEKHAVDRSIDAAVDIFSSLYDQGHLIGIAAYDTVPCWLGPSRGSGHLERIRQLFIDHPAVSSLPPDLVEKEGRYVDPMVHVRRQLPKNTQIFLFSPLTDSYTYEVARQLNGAGHLVTVISPDPTAQRTVGQRLARLQRAVWVNRLREHNIPVVDSKPDRPLRLDLEYAGRRWQ